MLMYGATQWECASEFNCNESTIARFVEDHYGMNFADLRAQQFSKIQLRLKQAQIRSALGGTIKKTYFDKRKTILKDGTRIEEMVPRVVDEEVPPNVVMQMWLGKQLLGQSDEAKIDQDLEQMRARFERPMVKIEVQNSDGQTIQELEHKWSDQAQLPWIPNDKPLANGHDKPEPKVEDPLDDLLETDD